MSEKKTFKKITVKKSNLRAHIKETENSLLKRARKEKANILMQRAKQTKEKAVETLKNMGFTESEIKGNKTLLMTAAGLEIAKRKGRTAEADEIKRQIESSKDSLKKKHKIETMKEELKRRENEILNRGTKQRIINYEKERGLKIVVDGKIAEDARNLAVMLKKIEHNARYITEGLRKGKEPELIKNWITIHKFLEKQASEEAEKIKALRKSNK